MPMLGASNRSLTIIFFLLAAFSSGQADLALAKAEPTTQERDTTGHSRDAAPDVHYRSQSILSPIIADRLPEWLQFLFYVPTEFTGSNIGDEDLVPLLKMPSVWKVVIYESKLSPLGMHNLRAMNGLTTIDLSYSEIDDSTAKLLVHHRKLRVVSLGGTQITDETIATLSRLPKLEELWLGGTSITDRGLKSLAKCSNLRILDVVWTSVSDSGVEEIAKLQQLEYLSLRRTSITNRSIKTLRRCRSLSSLDLSETAVDDAALTDVAAMKQLVSVDLSQTNVTRPGIERLKKARPNLRVSYSSPLKNAV